MNRIIAALLSIAITAPLAACAQEIAPEPFPGTLVLPAACSADCPMLEKEVVVNAPLDAVWNAWTTPEGLRFVSDRSNVELAVGGPYEWFLDLPPDEDGRRGGEGARILAFVPEQMLAFSWTFPPSIPSLRSAGATTTVVVLFDEIEPDTVHVQLHALGWESGADWREGWTYFDAAWAYVLEALKRDLEAVKGDVRDPSHHRVFP